jgi:hypothetical protein
VQPRYITQSSSGSSPWFPIDWWRNPTQIGLSVTSLSTTPSWSVEVTMDDPTGQFPNPTLNPGQPAGTSGGGTVGGKTVNAFASSAVGTLNGTAGGSSANAIGAILQPIAAIRITQNSTSGAATLTVLQAGPR